MLTSCTVITFAYYTYVIIERHLNLTTHVKPPHVNMERTDRWHPCECGLPFPRGLPIVVCLLAYHIMVTSNQILVALDDRCEGVGMPDVVRDEILLIMPREHHYYMHICLHPI